MTHITDEEILHVSKLAKLALSEDEVKKFGAQLSKIIEYVSHLKEVEVKNLEATAQVTGLENVYRDDKVVGQATLNQEEALSGSDKIYNGYFKVGAILAERSDK